MCGKNCVALATDTRFGAQHQTIASDFQRIFRINDKCFVGLSGLASDVQTVMDRINFRMNLYKLREDRNIAVRTFNDFLSSFLYERRFGPWFVEPLVAGLEGPENKPFIAGQDLLGAAVPVLLTVKIFPPVLLFYCVLMYFFFGGADLPTTSLYVARPKKACTERAKQCTARTWRQKTYLRLSPNVYWQPWIEIV